MTTYADLAQMDHSHAQECFICRKSNGLLLWGNTSTLPSGFYIALCQSCSNDARYSGMSRAQMGNQSIEDWMVMRRAHHAAAVVGPAPTVKLQHIVVLDPDTTPPATPKKTTPTYVEPKYDHNGWVCCEQCGGSSQYAEPDAYGHFKCYECSHPYGVDAP